MCRRILKITHDELSDEQIADVFDAWDLDRSGSLTVDEIFQALAPGGRNSSTVGECWAFLNIHGPNLRIRRISFMKFLKVHADFK